MTIVVSNKTRIHFQLAGERGAFVILQHGLFGSAQDWHDCGYVEALQRDFRLILPDARGHGRSDRPEDKAAYSRSQFSADLVTILDSLDIRNAHFVGYSLGALIGFDLAIRYPERVRLIVLGGEAPVVTEESRAHWRGLAERARSGSAAALIEAERAAERLAGRLPLDEETEREAALSMLEAMAEWEVSEEQRLRVRSPITILAGENDPAAKRTQSAARNVQRARFTSFSGFTHRGLFEEKTTLLAAILQFIKVNRRPQDGESSRDRQRSGGSADPEPGPAAGAEQAREADVPVEADPPDTPAGGEGVTPDRPASEGRGEASAAGATEKAEPGERGAPPEESAAPAPDREKADPSPAGAPEPIEPEPAAPTPAGENGAVVPEDAGVPESGNSDSREPGAPPADGGETSDP